jgi:hypothetical protein
MNKYSSYPHNNILRVEVEKYLNKCQETKKIPDINFQDFKPIVLQLIGFKPYKLFDGINSIEADIKNFPDEDDPLKKISRNGNIYILK